jgi:hypothetical protein
LNNLVNDNLPGAKAVARVLLESLILKHDASRFSRTAPVGAKAEARAAKRKDRPRRFCSW